MYYLIMQYHVVRGKQVGACLNLINPFQQAASGNPWEIILFWCHDDAVFFVPFLWRTRRGYCDSYISDYVKAPATPMS